MEKLKQFIQWFRDLGGAIDAHQEAMIKARYDYDSKPKSTFKERKEEVKRKYNYKFKKE